MRVKVHIEEPLRFYQMTTSSALPYPTGAASSFAPYSAVRCIPVRESAITAPLPPWQYAPASAAYGAPQVGMGGRGLV